MSESPLVEIPPVCYRPSDPLSSFKRFNGMTEELIPPQASLMEGNDNRFVSMASSCGFFGSLSESCRVEALVIRGIQPSAIRHQFGVFPEESWHRVQRWKTRPHQRRGSSAMAASMFLEVGGSGIREWLAESLVPDRW